MRTREEIEEDYIKKWAAQAKDLSDAHDLMPKDLLDYQIKMYNACLDMAYLIENHYLISNKE